MQLHPRQSRFFLAWFILTLALFAASAEPADLYAASMQVRAIPETAWEIQQAKVNQAVARDAVWLVATGAADIYSTAIGLHRCPPCREGNPILPTPEARIAFKVGYTGVAVFLLRKLRHDGHDRFANIARWGIVGINLFMTGNNTVRAVRRY